MANKSTAGKVQQAIILAVANRPMSFALGKSGDKHDLLFFDRGFNVLSARASSWGLIDKEVAGLKATTRGLPTVDVGVSHNCARWMDCKTASSGVDHARLLPELVKAIEVLKERYPKAFAKNPGRALALGGSAPDLVVGTLEELMRELGSGLLERAAKHTGSANSRRNMSGVHLGVVHDLALVLGEESLALACRQGRRRFLAAA